MDFIDLERILSVPRTDLKNTRRASLKALICLILFLPASLWANDSNPAPDSLILNQWRYYDLPRERFLDNKDAIDIEHLVDADLSVLNPHDWQVQGQKKDMIYRLTVFNDLPDSLFKLSFLSWDKVEVINSQGEVFRAGRMLWGKDQSNTSFVSEQIDLTVKIPSGQYSTLNFRFQSYLDPDVPADYPVQLSTTGFFKTQIWNERQHGIFLVGLLTIFFLFNFLLYLQTRDLPYLYYSIFIFGSLVVATTDFHLYPRLLEFPMRRFFILVVVKDISMVALVLFLRAFINTKLLIPRWDKFILWVVIGSVGITIIEVYQIYSGQINKLLFLANNAAVVLSLFLMAFLIRLLFTGDPLARYGAVGVLLVFAGEFIYSFTNLFDAYAGAKQVIADVGLVAELVLLSLGLGFRHRMIAQQKEEAQTKLIEQLEENKMLQTKVTLELEEKVKKRTMQIEAQKMELQTANATKDRLFSIISHDLRGPIASFETTPKILKSYLDRDQPEKVREMVDHIDKSAKNIHQLLDNLLSWSLKQKDELILNIEKLAIKPIIDETISIFIETAAFKGITIQSNIKDQYIMADRNTFATVVRNLISNAIKFSHPGSTISINHRVQDNWLEFSFTDTGVGMTEEQLQKLFDVDKSKVRSGTTNEKGTGLGMVLVKEFVAMNKGKISVESKPDEGTTFYVSLPLAS